MNHHINHVRIASLAAILGDLNSKVVFVGGATLSLYPSNRTLEVRPTEDIDIIIEILNYGQRVELEDKLRSIGFVNDVASGIICRWKIEKIVVDIVPTDEPIVVDIMPTDDPSIGFSNKWYPEGYKNSINYAMDERCTIRILDAPYFLATKFEAFKSRGNGNGRTSHDFEDIIYVLENRKEIWQEIKSASADVKEYLLSEFRNLLANPDIIEWIDCNVERASPPATYHIHEKLQEIVK